MFWKKKKVPTEKFTHESSNKRAAFRLKFDKNNSLEVEFKGDRFTIINLSATGMSFQNKGLAPGDSGRSKFLFEFTNQKAPVLMELEMQIIKIDKKNISHGIFQNCSEYNIEIVHKYILEKQKEKIRANKIK
ncbi:MAG: PilZ domain-containing protein [Desulfobacteraceae bacterium]|nr:PilZ domain-containing protein [Desulfobacteraceae bacterium]